MPERFAGLAPWLSGLLILILYVVIDRFGPAATHDSLYYLEGAGYWIQTGSFSNNYWGTVQPEVHYAPLFSAVLAFFAWLGGSTPLDVAQWLMPVLALLNLALLGWLLRLWQWSALHRASMLLIVGTAFPFFSMHWHIWSEPLYLSTILFAAIWLVKWQMGSKRSHLLLAAAVAGLSVLVRYAGLFMLPLFVLWIFTSQKDKRWTNSLLFSVVSLLPFLGWTARNKLVSQNLSSRSLFWDWAGVHELIRSVETVISWGNSALLAFALVIFCYRNKRNLLPASWILLLSGGIYVILVFLAKSAVDKQIPIDARMLSPLLLPMLLIFGREMLLWTAKQRALWMSIALAGGLLQGASFAMGAYREGWAFNNQQLFADGAPLAQMKAALPQGASLFANDVDAHYLAYLLGQPVIYLSIGDSVPAGGYFLRWQAALPEASTTQHCQEIVYQSVWYRPQ